jgi:hypothetical protein
MIQVQPKDFDDVGMGWLFAPIIGVLGLTRIALGITDSFLSKKTALSCLFCLFYSNLHRFRLRFMHDDNLWRELVLEFLFRITSLSMSNGKHGRLSVLHK